MPSPPPKPGVKGPPGAPADARSREELERQDRHRTVELGDACERLEEDLEMLKARFELYFLGIDRREPSRERMEMKRRVARLKTEFTRNTGLRFRIETLHARFLSYERMWVRSAREKEEGTYRRDLQRARRKAELEGKREEEKARQAEGGRTGPAPVAEARTEAAIRSADPPRALARSAGVGAGATATASAVPPPAAGAVQRPAASPPTGPPPAPPLTPSPSTGPGQAESRGGAAPVKLAAAPAGSGMSEEKLRALYAAYVEAKKRCNEDVSRISYEALAKSVSKQVPELMARYKAKTVEFKVVIKDGHAILKAVPRV